MPDILALQISVHLEGGREKSFPCHLLILFMVLSISVDA